MKDLLTLLLALATVTTYGAIACVLTVLPFYIGFKILSILLGGL